MKVAFKSPVFAAFLWMVFSGLPSVNGSKISSESLPKGLYNFVSYYEVTFLHYVWPLRDSSEAYGKNDLQTRLMFKAFGQTFDLTMTKQTSFPESTVDIFGKSGLIREYSLQSKSTSLGIFEGQLQGDTYSTVSGFFSSDGFTGTIHSQNQTYFIEPAKKYLENISYSSAAIVYRGKDISYSKCGSDQDQSVKCAPRNDVLVFRKGKKFRGSERDDFITEEPDVLNYTQDMNRPFFDGFHEKTSERMCRVELVSDHTFYESLLYSETNTLAVLYYHAKNADAIFRRTDFDGDGEADGVRIIVDRIVVFTDREFPGYPMGIDTKEASKFILDFSRRLQKYCVSICMCHRAFNDDVVGLAFRADPNVHGSAGGICQSPIRTHSGEVLTTNTAIVSSLSSKTELPLAITTNSFVHELGHSFGSHHDPIESSLCSPGGEGGNYVMTRYTVDNSKPHHRMFSPCSRKIMHQVIHNKGSCLETKKKPSCGNGIREEGEECDCGEYSTCHLVDPCCTPKGGLGTDTECTFRRELGYECSTFESPCCTGECTIVPASKQRHCIQDAFSCRQSTCNGLSAECPDGELLPDGAPCRGTSQTCSAGMCNSTTCADHGLDDCTCNPESGMECHVCCYNATEKTCLPAKTLGFKTLSGRDFFRYPGAFCNHRTAKCNSLGECLDIYRERSEAFQWLAVSWTYVVMGFLCFTIFVALCFICHRKRPLYRPTTIFYIPTPSPVMQTPMYQYPPPYNPRNNQV